MQPAARLGANVDVALAGEAPKASEEGLEGRAVTSKYIDSHSSDGETGSSRILLVFAEFPTVSCILVCVGLREGTRHGEVQKHAGLGCNSPGVDVDARLLARRAS